MSTKKLSKSKKGFTIIEVVLVLAIAGLIFLMVFVALPALQRSQRDTQRRDDIARVSSALTQWQSNHNNSLPAAGVSSTNNTAAQTFLTQYLQAGSTFNDPDGNPYVINVAAGQMLSNAAELQRLTHTIFIRTAALCDNNGGAITASASPSDFAILYRTEGSGVICYDSK